MTDQDELNKEKIVSLDFEAKQHFPTFDEPVHVAKQREFARQWVALLIVGSLTIIVIGSFVLVWLKGAASSIDDIIKLIQALIGPVVGIVGAVTGFYFGEMRDSRVSGVAQQNK